MRCGLVRAAEFIAERAKRRTVYPRTGHTAKTIDTLHTYEIIILNERQEVNDKGSEKVIIRLCGVGEGVSDSRDNGSTSRCTIIANSCLKSGLVYTAS